MTAILTANLCAGSLKKPIRNLTPATRYTGGSAGRFMSVAQGFQFTLIWTYRPYTDVQAVQAFFDANKDTSFTYDWPLEPSGPYSTYTCTFAKEPHYRPSGYAVWDIRAMLYGKVI